MTNNKLTENSVTQLLNSVHLARDNAERDDNRVDHSFYYALAIALEELQERRKADSAEPVSFDALNAAVAEVTGGNQHAWNAAIYKGHQAVPFMNYNSLARIVDKYRAPQPAPVGLKNGWVAVPVEPTEDMIIAGFESGPDEHFSKPDEWEQYESMSGCQQAAHRARLCWNAMIAAAPEVDGL